MFSPNKPHRIIPHPLRHAAGRVGIAIVVQVTCGRRVAIKSYRIGNDRKRV